jgi:hypothetical protein
MTQFCSDFAIDMATRNAVIRLPMEMARTGQEDIGSVLPSSILIGKLWLALILLIRVSND